MDVPSERVEVEGIEHGSQRRMRMKKGIPFGCLLLVVISINAQQIDFPKLTGPYLGQKPPGKTAVLFAPDILTYELHESPVFLPNDSGVIIGTMAEGLKFYTYANGKWSFPGKATFPLSETISGIEVAPSGERINFLIWENSGVEKFWFIEKRGNRWTSLQSLGDEINSFKTHWQFSLSRSGDL